MSGWLFQSRVDHRAPGATNGDNFASSAAIMASIWATRRRAQYKEVAQDIRQFIEGKDFPKDSVYRAPRP